MSYVLKSKPDDFIVEERANLPLVKSGEFAVYRLVKTDRNTDDVVQECAGHLGVALRDCSYGGRKDRHGITTQYMAIRNQNKFSLKKDSFSLGFIGFMDRPMGPDLIEGNFFTLVVRKLSDADVSRAFEEIALVQQYGFVNYFDDQRFGSFDEKQGFFAEKLLKKEFNGALKIYLTSLRAQDRKSEKERKRFFLDKWRDWDECFKRAETDFEKKAFSYLNKHPNGFVPLLSEIPRHELAIYFSAFQSFLWNEIARRYVKYMHKPLLQHRGVVGEYCFYRALSLDEMGQWQKSVIPMPGVKVSLPGEPIDSIYQSVMADHKITKGLFNSQKVRTFYFKSFPRAVIVMPRDIASSTDDDDVYGHAKKLTLSFSLSRGSFATMLIKRIFSV